MQKCMMTERDGVEIYFLEFPSLFLFLFFLRLWPPLSFLSEFFQTLFPFASNPGKLVQYRPRGGEEVAQTQTLEAFYFQASQPISGTALIVFFKQVKIQNVKKHLEAGHSTRAYDCCGHAGGESLATGGRTSSNHSCLGFIGSLSSGMASRRRLQTSGVHCGGSGIMAP